MGFFYVDDSKHPAAGFCLSAIVYSNVDLQLDLESTLIKYGLSPGHDEFKSSIRMDLNPERKLLRTDLMQYLHRCAVGVAISRISEEMYEYSAQLLQWMSGLPLPLDGPHQLFADRGIFPKYREQEVLRAIPGTEGYQFHFEQDSRKVCGIQLADLAAHTCSIMLKDELGLVRKTIKAGENSGYDPDTDIELGFEMWAGMRYCFHLDYASNNDSNDGHPILPNLGLAISPKLDGRIQAAARDRFSTMYLGCIH